MCFCEKDVPVPAMEGCQLRFHFRELLMPRSWRIVVLTGMASLLLVGTGQSEKRKDDISLLMSLDSFVEQTEARVEQERPPPHHRDSR